MTRSTPSQTVGPFFRFGLEWLAVPEMVSPADPGALAIAGFVLDGAGAPVPDAVVEVWQADVNGGFGAAPEDAASPGVVGWGRCLSGPDGSWGCTTVKPGRVDDLQAPHLAVTLFCRGILQRLVTRIYFPDEMEANATDPVLTAAGDRAATLVAVSDGPRALRHDLVLQGERETVFFVF